MKSFTVILSRTGTTAKCHLRYDDASWPAEATWTGDRGSFRLADGNLPTMLCTMDRVQETAKHQAQQSGAKVTVLDHGGDAPMRIDNVKGTV